MSRVQEAVDCFNKMHNCCQAVFSTYCEQLGLDKETALKLATGFAGGMALQGEACGAVVGAFMLIGLKHGRINPQDVNAKEKTYELMQEFTGRFKEKYDTIVCRELLGDTPLTGDSNILNDKYTKLCPIIVRDAAGIVEELLFG